MDDAVDDSLAADLASTALATARRFHAGATMWCVAPRWEPHAQHVAVEFVHPVIVGKRALPAVALTGPDLVATALEHRDVERIVTTIFEEITDALAQRERVELRGFGAFSTRGRDARKGRNPRTGEAVDVSAKSVPYFKPGKEMRERLNLQEVTAE